jgi:hypothetical protein
MKIEFNMLGKAAGAPVAIPLELVDPGIGAE